MLLGVIWNLGQFDHINQIITLTVITLFTKDDLALGNSHGLVVKADGS